MFGVGVRTPACEDVALVVCLECACAGGVWNAECSLAAIDIERLEPEEEPPAGAAGEGEGPGPGRELE